MSSHISAPVRITHLDLRGAQQARLHYLKHMARQEAKGRKAHPSIYQRVALLNEFIKEQQLDGRLERGWGGTW